MELWELVARESIRDRIARWNANGDAGRVSEMVKVLAPTVEFQAGDGPLIHGRDAVEAYMGGVRASKPAGPETEAPVHMGRYVAEGGRPSLRHFTGTTVIDLLSPTSARVRTYYAVLSSFGLDHWGRYLDEFEVVDDTWLIIKRTVTTEGVDPEGWAGSFAG